MSLEMWGDIEVKSCSDLDALAERYEDRYDELARVVVSATESARRRGCRRS
jgi:hypothetical protein